MARFKKLYKKKKEGKIVYGDGIVNSIVKICIAEIPYVELCSTNKPTKLDISNAIKVKFDRQDVFVDVAVKIHYTQSVSQMAFKIQEVVRHNVEAMTEYHVGGVNVHVNGVIFDDSPALKANKKKAKKATSKKIVEQPKEKIDETIKDKKD